MPPIFKLTVETDDPKDLYDIIDALSGVSDEQAPTIKTTDDARAELNTPPAPPAAPAAAPQHDTTESDAVDTDGLPWDERIHAGTKSKNADGRWKRKRGVDAALVEQVEAELKGATAPEPAANADCPPIPDFLKRQPEPQNVTFEQVIQVLTNALQAVPPVMTQADVVQLYESVGLPADLTEGVNAMRNDQHAMNRIHAIVSEKLG